MAPKLTFGKDDPSVSYRPFEREWDLLREAKATDEVRSMNLIALKSSNIEYLIPKAFRFLFLLIILLVLGQSAIMYRTVDNAPTLGREDRPQRESLRERVLDSAQDEPSNSRPE